MEIRKLIEILHSFEAEGIESVYILRKDYEDIFIRENIISCCYDFDNKCVILLPEYFS